MHNKALDGTQFFALTGLCVLYKDLNGRIFRSDGRSQLLKDWPEVISSER